MKENNQEQAEKKDEENKINSESSVIDKSKEESIDESAKPANPAKPAKPANNKEKKEAPVNGSFRFNQKNKS